MYWKKVLNLRGTHLRRCHLNLFKIEGTKLKISQYSVRIESNIEKKWKKKLFIFRCEQVLH